MPKRIKKPCRAKQCSTLHRNRSGYCDDHADMATGWVRSHQGKTAAQRGYGKEWEVMRKETLESDGYLCRSCRANGIHTPATDVDHIVPKAQCGTDAATNRQSLCGACHSAKTLAERTRGGLKVESL